MSLRTAPKVVLERREWFHILSPQMSTMAIPLGTDVLADRTLCNKRLAPLRPELPSESQCLPTLITHTLTTLTPMSSMAVVRDPTARALPGLIHQNRIGSLEPDLPLASSTTQSTSFLNKQLPALAELRASIHRTLDTPPRPHVELSLALHGVGKTNSSFRMNKETFHNISPNPREEAPRILTKAGRASK